MTGTEQQGVALVAGRESPVASAMVDRLRATGWTPALDLADGAGQGMVTALVYEPGLWCGEDNVDVGAIVDEFTGLVERALPRLRSGADCGARIVVVTSRDGLGWHDRPNIAATSAALVASARSLALRLGPSGITVNVVAALPPVDSPLRASGQPAGTHLNEPDTLLPEPVTVQDIARTVAFFLDSRSGYITGQVLYCCGGASLLSSLSV